MEKNQGMLHCEYCSCQIVEHINYIAIILSRRANGIGVECDDCMSARQKKENELYEKEGFPEWVKTQHSHLTQASQYLKTYLETGGSHFFPIEYDAYDLDGDVKNAKSKIDFLRVTIKNVFAKILDEEH